MSAKRKPLSKADRALIKAATNAIRSWPSTGNHACGESSRMIVNATRPRKATTLAVLGFGFFRLLAEATGLTGRAKATGAIG